MADGCGRGPQHLCLSQVEPQGEAGLSLDCGHTPAPPSTLARAGGSDGGGLCSFGPAPATQGLCNSHSSPTVSRRTQRRLLTAATLPETPTHGNASRATSRPPPTGDKRSRPSLILIPPQSVLGIGAYARERGVPLACVDEAGMEGWLTSPLAQRESPPAASPALNRQICSLNCSLCMPCAVPPAVLLGGSELWLAAARASEPIAACIGMDGVRAVALAETAGHRPLSVLRGTPGPTTIPTHLAISSQARCGWGRRRGSQGASGVQPSGLPLS
jgi:hypothetical protein